MTGRRAWVWLALGLFVIGVGTGVALYRQQRNIDSVHHLTVEERANLADHERLDDRACMLALQNRELIVKILDSFGDVPGVGTEVVARLAELSAEAQALVDETRAECADR